MALTKIKVENLKKGEQWYNLVYLGKSLGIRVDSNPKTIAAIEGGATEIELNINPAKDGSKYWGFDPQPQRASGGFKRDTPEQAAAKLEFEERKQRMIIAQNCMSNAAHFYAKRSTGGMVELMAMANDMYSWVMTKANEN